LIDNNKILKERADIQKHPADHAVPFWWVIDKVMS
jgi:hypothetical protein